MDDSFWNFLWWTFAWFLLIAFLILLFQIFADIFRDHELSGWGKAAWSIFLIFVPFLGALVYLIARGGGMAQRQMHQAQAVQEAQADYIRSVAGNGSGGSAADQVAQAKSLLDAGAISSAEFEQLKAKALA